MELSISVLITVLVSGLCIGWLAEFSYKSLEREKIVWPLLVNVQMYGYAGVFSYFLFLLHLSPALVILLILVFTTGIEFAIGYFLLRFKGVRLWDYTENIYNYKGIVCAEFSLYWLGAALLYYYVVLPSIVGV